MAVLPQFQIDDVLGIMRYCPGCEEWWPNDEDFWRPHLWSGRAVCRACAAEARRKTTVEASRRYRAKQEGQAV